MRTVLWTMIAILTMAMGGKRPVIPNDSTTTPPSSSLPDPEPYQAQFKSLGKTYGARFAAESVTFGFKTFYGGVVGMCTFYGSRQNKVQFHTSAWKNGSATFREMLAFHELGHCLLGRGHRNSTHSDGRPESVMRSSMFSERTYLANRDAYLKELFTAEASMMFSVATKHDFDDCKFGK